jgi:diguanylate cyclase (GGDEF)-like protein
MFDVARNIGDVGDLLATAGISLEGHTTLLGGAVVEFVEPSDAWLVSEVGLAAQTHGTATRRVHLRSGRPADLHLVELGDDTGTTVIVIVPDTGDTMGAIPPPTAVVASPRVGVALCNAFGVVTSASASTLALLGRPNETLEGEPIIHLLHPDEREMAIANWVAAKEQRGVALRWRCRVIRADGSALWVEVTLTNDIDEAGGGDVRADLYDISPEVAATEALAAETELLALLTETLPVGVAKFDALGRVEHANGRLAALLAPQCPNELFEQAARGELQPPDLGAAFGALLHEGAASLLIVEHAGSGGKIRHLEWTIRPVVADTGEVTGGVACVADVTEAVELGAALEHRATTDALTGCLNRAGTMAAIEQALAAVGANEGVGLLFIDLNGFKRVNDARGHAIGDAVLELVASRLRGALRGDDLLGRLGGDEFVVIAPRLASATAAHVLAGRMSRRLHGVATIGTISIAISASIGVAWSSASTASELLAEADTAMYAAKQTRSAVPVLAPSSSC